MATINERVKELRRMENLTQVQFAKKLGVTNAHISKIEKGKTVPSEALIKLMCNVFGVNEEWLKDADSQIYLNDIEYVQEENFEKATREHNKLLKSNDPIFRFKISQLDVIIQEIINVDTLNDQDKKKYVEMISNLFDVINETMRYIKSYSFDNQLSFIQNDIDKVLAYQLDRIKNELKEFGDYYIKSNYNK